jgi:hypothetical protein
MTNTSNGPDDARTSEGVDIAYERYAMHLSRKRIDEVFHYAHYIPRGRGITATFFAENYPGWTIETMHAVFRAADIISLDDPCGLMGKCHWKVKALHFNSVTNFEVEWNNEIEEDDGRYFWRGDHPDDMPTSGPQTDTGGFLIDLDGLDLRKRRVRKKLTSAMAELLGDNRRKRQK